MISQAVNRLAERPAMVILIGRTVALGGFFVFGIAPAIVLPDAAFNDLTIALTIALLVIVAPLSAFHLYLMRLDHAERALRQLSLTTSVAALPLIGVYAVATIALSDLTRFSVVAIGMGASANSIVNLCTSCIARGERFARSAAVDAISGIGLGVASITLVLGDASHDAWAAGFSAVWASCALLGLLAATAITDRTTAPLRLNIQPRAAIPMILSGVVTLAFNKLDYLVLTVVAAESESSRYAIATRVAGPIMIVLGSLNNSLFVLQVQRRERLADLRAVTSRLARRILVAALCGVPATAVVILVTNAVFPALRARSLLIPSILIAVAAVPFAATIPWAFALNALGRERRWMWIVSLATLANAAAVRTLSDGNATGCALIWVATQLVVAALVYHERQAAGLR